MENRLNYELLKNKKTEINKIFFFRICGTGMGAAASLLKEKGYEVEGADIDFYPPMSTYLHQQSIELHKIGDIDSEFLKNYDLVVVGNVVPGKSEHAKLIEESGVFYTSFPEVLGAYVLDNREVVGISGTHGKTTTTFLALQVFEKLGCSPGYFIGGVLDDRNSAEIGEDNLFFIESDEYDTAYFEKTSKFHHYSINHLIITSLEFDHADIFTSESDILNEFQKLLNSKKDNVIENIDYPLIKKIKMVKPSVKTSYGASSVVGPMNIIFSNERGTTFDLKWDHKNITFQTNLSGDHNILNLSAVIIFALQKGFGVSEIQKAIKNLNLVKRRQEIVGKINDAVVVDDFAHHPTAVKYTLETMKQKYSTKRLVAIFEPASSTARSSIFENRFIESLKIADLVIVIAPAKDTTVKGGENISIENIASSLKESSIECVSLEDLGSLEKYLAENINENDVVVTLSNAKILGLMKSKILQRDGK